MNHANLHRSVLALTLIAALAAQSGCGPAGGSQTKITNRRADASSQWSDDLFTFALENLNHLEDNDCEEMLRSTQQRLAALQQPNLVGNQVPDALLASWPEPDMLRQVVSRLNQWVDTQEKPAAWKPDPMLATLPTDLTKLPMIENLGEAHFTAYDGYMLMEAVWLRDVARSKGAGGGTADELQVARSLFDWTVRNIQTDYDRSDRVPQLPWETLFLGHGTSLERAWTYILLLRQRGIDAALLALPVADSSPGADAAKTSQAGKSSPATPSGKESLKPWCVGVLIGDTRKEKGEKSIYLFDPKLRLPIPGPDGIAADKSGQLDLQPATLGQVVADPKLLDRLALSPDQPYWAKAADLKRSVAWIESSPLYLSPRAKRIEARLTGEQKLVLNAEPSPQAARFKAAGVTEVQIWQLPYRTLQGRLALSSGSVCERLRTYLPFIGLGAGSLYKGRVLHLKGRFEDERGAIAYYQKARPRNRDVLAEESKHVQACYHELVTRWKEQRGENTLTPEIDQFCKREAALLINAELEAIRGGKVDASYWLGLIQYDQVQYESALDYFRIRVMQLDPQTHWGSGAHYNIARCFEASGQRQKAIDWYESSILLHNDTGNLLRARWLKMLDGEKNQKPEEKVGEKKIGEKKTEEKKPDAGTKYVAQGTCLPVGGN